MPPEPDSLSASVLDRLFPFHITFDGSVDSCIAGVGPALGRLLGTVWRDARLDDLFELARPRGGTVDLGPLSESGRTIVLKHRHGPLSLRGFVVALAERRFVFACSVEVTSSDALEELGLAIRDFAPADPTPDIIILHRFRELQQVDQQKQIEALRDAVAERDTFDRHAHTDALTGIGNRRALWSEGSTFLDTLPEDRTAVIVLMDLDGFKRINDTYGHDVGDEVLQVVARRCRRLVGERGIVARLGGDEFVALVRLDADETANGFLAEWMSSASEPMSCLERHVGIRPSVGVAALERTHTIDEAIRRADLAMYEGRRKTRGSISWFTQAMQTADDYRRSLLADIGPAVASGEFVPHFQPIVDVRTRRIHGYEALARWQHPTRGLVPPDDFIALAAEAGCLHELDHRILESSLDQLARWDGTGRRFSIHVNLSGSSVRAGLDGRIMTLLADRNIDASRLTLELTETTLLDFDASEREVLNRLVEQGVSLELDDFGTGYSSLRHLHDFPVKGVKVDRSFLVDFPGNERSAALVESVMEIASHLGMSVVTEGIETAEQLDWIGSIGGEFGQGYLFGKPAPAHECTHTLALWQAPHAKAA